MKKVLVVGSINLDIVLEVEEFPSIGENVIAKKINFAYGGKGANAAIAIKNLMNEIEFCGSVGKDDEGNMLLSNLRKHKLSTENIIISEKASGKSYITVNSKGENYIVVSMGANMEITRECVIKNIAPLIDEVDIILIQLEIDLGGIKEIINICKNKNKKLIIDAGPVRDFDVELFRGVFILSPNETEFESLTNQKFENIEKLIEKAIEFREKLEIKHLIIKMGEKGIIFINNQGVQKYDVYKVRAVDSTAAGDSFMAGLITGIAEGKDLEEAIDLGMKCGAICVTRIGASNSLPKKEDLENFESFLIK